MNYVNYASLIILICCINNVYLRRQKYLWYTTEEWSHCSKSCGMGLRSRLLICFERNFYYEKLVSNNKCNKVPKPKVIQEPCNLGRCNSGYYWHASKWGRCSQTCGATGRKVREVECVYDEGNNVTVTAERRFCPRRYQPEIVSPCNIIDCPPVFYPGDWGKCVISFRCRPGKQRRQIMCVSILRNGTRVIKPKAACYMMISMHGKPPPPTWKKCYENVNTKECTDQSRRPAVIDSMSSTLIQMRRMRKMRLRVGQIAYVLLYTNVIVRCPVKYFVPSDLVWKHDSKAYKYKGKVKKRIKIDQKGRLRIKRFQLRDQGAWICMAGSVKSEVIIKVRDPSQGFQDWVLRTMLFNKRMMNSDNGMQSDTSGGFDLETSKARWVSGRWSGCSVTCGGYGIQTRRVQCELPSSSRHYTVLKSNKCGGASTKPLTERKCRLATDCPVWKLTKSSTSDLVDCTDECMSIGIGHTNDTLQCIHQGYEVALSKCDQRQKPEIKCKNPKCQPKWRVSKWSKCSKSCGGEGVIGRFMLCVWQTNGKPAGTACYDQKLKEPIVVKKCKAPACILDCVDLRKSCKESKYYCRTNLYQFTCCKSCKAVFKRLRNKARKIRRKERRKMRKRRRFISKRVYKKGKFVKYNKKKPTTTTTTTTTATVTAKQLLNESIIISKVNNSPAFSANATASVIAGNEDDDDDNDDDGDDDDDDDDAFKKSAQKSKPVSTD